MWLERWLGRASANCSQAKHVLLSLPLKRGQYQVHVLAGVCSLSLRYIYRTGASRSNGVLSAPPSGEHAPMNAMNKLVVKEPTVLTLFARSRRCSLIHIISYQKFILHDSDEKTRSRFRLVLGVGSCRWDICLTSPLPRLRLSLVSTITESGTTRFTSPKPL